MPEDIAKLTPKEAEHHLAVITEHLLHGWPGAVEEFFERMEWLSQRMAL